MSVWTDAQRRAWQRALATCARLEPLVRKLRAMAPHMPQYAEQVRDLELRWQHCKMLAEVAIAADDPTSAAEG